MSKPVPHVAPDERVPAGVELGPLRLITVVALLFDVTLPDGNPDGLGAGSGVVGRNRDGARRVAAVARVAWSPEGSDRIALEPVKPDNLGATDALTGPIAEVGVTGIRPRETAAAAKQRLGRNQDDPPNLETHVRPFSIEQ